MEENNNLYEEKKNSNKVLIGIIIVLSLALLGLSYYTFFVRDKVDNTDKPIIEDNKDKEEQIDKELEEFPYLPLIRDYEKNGSNISDETKLYITYLMKEDKIQAYEITENNNILYYNVNGETLKIEGLGGAYPRIYNKELFQKELIKIFGKDNSMFENSFETKILSGCAPITVNYNKEYNTIMFHPGGGCIAGDVSTVYKVNKENNIIKSDVIVGYTDYTKSYSYDLYDKESGTIIKQNINYEDIEEILKDNQDKLPHYEVTFKIVEGAYQFDSIVKK